MMTLVSRILKLRPARFSLNSEARWAGSNHSGFLVPTWTPM